MLAESAVQKKSMQELKVNAWYLQTPVRGNIQENRPKTFLRWMVGTRSLIETVIGQLKERFKIERIRARDQFFPSAFFEAGRPPYGLRPSRCVISW
jgi:Transposase DDE domain